MNLAAVPAVHPSTVPLPHGFLAQHSVLRSGLVVSVPRKNITVINEHHDAPLINHNGSPAQP